MYVTTVVKVKETVNLEANWGGGRLRRVGVRRGNGLSYVK